MKIINFFVLSGAFGIFCAQSISAMKNETPTGGTSDPKLIQVTEAEYVIREPVMPVTFAIPNHQDDIIHIQSADPVLEWNNKNKR